jgi:hypothetical protein
MGLAVVAAAIMLVVAAVVLYLSDVSLIALPAWRGALTGYTRPTAKPAAATGRRLQVPGRGRSALTSPNPGRALACSHTPHCRLQSPSNEPSPLVARLG